MRYRKKPVEVDAIRFTGDLKEAVAFLPDGSWRYDVDTESLIIRTLEGDMVTRVGDYIVRGVAGEYYPVRADIFAATYEPPGSVETVN